MKCINCKYCVQKDYGYSNWTVEGTEADCLLNLHPNFPIDRFYGDEPELDFAKKCENFTEGESVEIDCDQEGGEVWEYSDDPEIIELLKKWDS